MDPDGSLQIHHVVLKASLNDLIMLVALVTKTVPCILAHSVQSQHFCPGDKLLVTANNHPAFTSDNIFGGVEAEAAEVAEGASFAPVPGCFNGMGAIFNDCKAMFVGNRHDCVHVTWAACKMHWQNRACTGGDRCFDCSGIDVLRRCIDICQNRSQPGMDNGIHGSTKRHWCCDDFRTLLQTCCDHADMQCRRA